MSRLFTNQNHESRRAYDTISTLVPDRRGGGISPWQCPRWRSERSQEGSRGESRRN